MTEEAHSGRCYLIDKCCSDNKAMNNNCSPLLFLDTSVGILLYEMLKVGNTRQEEDLNRYQKGGLWCSRVWDVCKEIDTRVGVCVYVCEPAVCLHLLHPSPCSYPTRPRCLSLLLVSYQGTARQGHTCHRSDTDRGSLKCKQRTH